MHFSVSELWSSIGIFAKVILTLMMLMSLASVYVTCERLVVFIKSKKAATSNWSNLQLTEAQLVYAANDAYAALRVFQALQLA